MFSAVTVKRWLAVAAFTVLCGLCVAEPTNIRPLAFGMTADEASLALRGPLLYVRGRPGSEIYLFERRADVPGIYPVADRVFLQFRRGRLTGWKRDWHIPRSSIW